MANKQRFPLVYKNAYIPLGKWKSVEFPEALWLVTIVTCSHDAWSHVWWYDQLTVRAGEKPARTGVKTLIAVSNYPREEWSVPHRTGDPWFQWLNIECSSVAPFDSLITWPPDRCFPVSKHCTSDIERTTTCCNVHDIQSGEGSSNRTNFDEIDNVWSTYSLLLGLFGCNGPLSSFRCTL